MEERYFGKISFPNSATQAIENIWLTISENSIYLEIPFHIFAEESWEIVLGQFTGGANLDIVTLLNGRLSGGTSGSGGSFRRLYVESIIKGKHYLKNEDIKFKEVWLKSPALLEWLRIHHTVETENGRDYLIPELEKVIDVRLEGLTFGIHLAHGATHGRHNTNITHHCNITLVFDQFVGIQEIREKVYLVKKFVLFITNSDPNFSEMGLSEDENIVLSWVKLFPMIEEKNFSANIYIHHLQIHEQIGSLLKLWFGKNKIQYIIDLMLEKYFNTRLSMPRFFQNMCIAIESYHSNFIQKKLPIADQTIIKKRNSIIKLLAENNELEVWFKEKSNFWIKPQLYDRLIEFNELIERIVGDTIDCGINDLIRKIKQARDEITHEGVTDNRFNSTEIILIAKTLEFTVKLSILKSCGVNIDVQNHSLIDDAQRLVSYLAKANHYQQRSSS